MLADLSNAPVPPAAAPYPAEPYARDELLHEIFSATAARFPDRPALRLADPDPEVPRNITQTYGQLRSRAARFARYLRRRGLEPGDRVVICLPRGLDQYMAILGALEAGLAYAPVDWAYPQERIDYVAADSGARAAITLAERSQGFPAGLAIVALDEELGDIAAEADTPFSREETGVDPSALAYLIYTSGTTGRPKGVMIRHSNACHFVRSEGAILGVTADDRIYGGFSLAFDMSVETMWSAWLAGAELIVGSEGLAQAGPDLAPALEAHDVTIWHVTPSLLAVVHDEVPSCRLINLGGEACPPELVRRWSRPGRILLNTYGPTETAVTATWTELVPEHPVTIGRPLPGYLAWIVDGALRPVEPGAEGELVIGGPGVGAGYVNLPELTREKFTVTPFDGPDGAPVAIYRTGDLCRLDSYSNIEFLGRIDTQVKIRGYRVELGEIEAVLGEDPAVAQAVVQLFPASAEGEELLAAFLAPRRGAAIDLGRLREAVRTRLPAYMRPQAYEVVQALPTLTSGKVDRKALKRPAEAAMEARIPEPPATELEQRLLAVWTQVFHHPGIGVLDDFFEDLGGHSLRAAGMVSLARADPLFAAMSIKDLYDAPTIRALALRMQAKAGAGGPRPPPDHSFSPISQGRRTLCVVAQTLALIPIYAFAGLQWLAPYLIYTWVSTVDGRLHALAYAAAAFVVMPPVLILLSVVVKWAVLGRARPGDHPLWGLYYFRWWVVRQFLGVIPVEYLSGTPMMAIYYRWLGARIGKDAFLGLNRIDTPDLVSIGEGAIISEGALLAVSSVERGLLRLGPVEIGPRATVGVQSVVGRGARLGEGAVLEDLSAVPGGESVPDGEIWTGSPAERRGPARPIKPAPPVSARRRAAVVAGLVGASVLLPFAAVLPIAPGLIAMIEIDWNTVGYSYVALAPALALAYVVLMCLLNVAVKWMLLGRIAPGTYSRWSAFYVRYWFAQKLGLLALDLLHPIYATLYVSPWYRAMGARVGARAEISTATSVVHDLVDIGEESFIADGVVFGAARPEPGGLRLERTSIGRRSFIGNSALLPTGTDIGDEVLIGVLSKPPDDARAALESHSTWFGSPALRLPNRQSFARFDEGARFRPGKRLIALRLAIEYVRVTLPLTVFISLFSITLSIMGDLADRPHGLWWIVLSFPAIYLAFCIAAGLSVVVLKWLVIGRYRPTAQPLWSLFVWRTELVTAAYENLAVPLLLQPLRGTPYLNLFLRLMGCRIGRRAFIDTTDITEHDLVSVGDDAALNEDAGLQTHLFEDRVMKVSQVRIGPRATVGSMAVVLYDAALEEDAQLGDLSVVMKGETLAAGSSWEGAPAAPARSHAP